MTLSRSPQCRVVMDEKSPLFPVGGGGGQWLQMTGALICSFLTQNQNCLLVTLQNDNHSPGPGLGRLVCNYHQRSELSNSILGAFHRGDKRSVGILALPFRPMYNPYHHQLTLQPNYLQPPTARTRTDTHPHPIHHIPFYPTVPT